VAASSIVVLEITSGRPGADLHRAAEEVSYKAFYISNFLVGADI